MTDPPVPGPRASTEAHAKPIRGVAWWQQRLKDLQFLRHEKRKLLRQAELSRIKASKRRNYVIEVWREEQKAKGTPQALRDAADKRIYDAYGGKRASDDPVLKAHVSDNVAYLTRASAMATVEIALRLEIENEQSARRYEQNEEILALLKHLSKLLTK